MRKRIVFVGVCIVVIVTAFFVASSVLHRVKLKRFEASNVPPPPEGSVSVPETGRVPIETRRPNLDVMLIAHRGASNLAPENTLPALERAVAIGADYIELDVRLTVDGEPVLIHDSDLSRTTNGSGRIESLTLEEVRRLDAGSSFAPEFAGTGIPTLEESLAELRGRACILWDAKDHATTRTVELFKSYGYGDSCLLVMLHEFERDQEPVGVTELLRHWPDAPLMVRVRNIAEMAIYLKKYPQIKAVSVSENYLTDSLVDSAHAAGLLVVATAMCQSDNPRYYARYVNAGVDAIFLDEIVKLQSWLKVSGADNDQSLSAPEVSQPDIPFWCR